MQINIPVFYFYVEASWGFCRLALFLLRLLTVTKFSTVGDLVGMVDDAFIPQMSRGDSTFQCLLD